MSAHLSQWIPTLKIFVLTSILFFVCPNEKTQASDLKLINTDGVESAVTLKGFDEKSRTIQIDKAGKSYNYSLDKLSFSSKIEVLRSSEMQQTLQQKSQMKSASIQLYGELGLAVIILAFVIGFPTFKGAAFLTTGQEGQNLHFKAWLKILALATLIAGIRYATLGGITWLDVLASSYRIFHPGDGLAVIFFILASILLIKTHYRETLQLTITIACVHFVFFSLVMAALLWLVWQWNGNDWTTTADIILTHLILRPFELI